MTVRSMIGVKRSCNVESEHRLACGFKKWPYAPPKSKNQERMLTTMSSDDSICEKRPFFMDRFPFLLLLVPALIGTFASGFLTYRHILLSSHVGEVGQSFLCRADGRIDCDSVLLTDYAVLFWYVPSAVLGLMGFTFVLWCVISGLANEHVRKVSWALLILYFFAAIEFSGYYSYIMMFKVDLICTWCIVAHVVNLFSLIYVVAVAVKRRQAFSLSETATVGERFFFVTGGIAVSLLVFFVAGMWEKSLSFDEAKAKIEGLANDPAAILALPNGDPSYEVPVTSADPVFGSPAVPYPIILFSDFQCPVCPRVEHLLRSLVELNSQDIKLVFKNLPLSRQCNNSVVGEMTSHAMACPAAQAAYAAFVLGGHSAFWAYADLLYSQQSKLKSSIWLEFALKLDLDSSKFLDLMRPDSPAAKKVAEDVELAVKLKVSGTPQVFLEGKSLLPENFKEANLIDATEELIRANHPERKDFRIRRRN